MKITLLPKPSRRLVMTIFVDDEPWVDIHTKIFGRLVSLPSCNTLEELQEKFFELEYTKTKKYTLDCLAMRSYPSSQLKKLLQRNLVSNETIQKVLQDCMHLGYLNDEEWIQRFIQTQFKRHVSPLMILYKLVQKGISKQDAERYVDQWKDSDTSIQSIQHLLNTKYKRHDLSDFRAKQKVYGALMRRGFDSESIKAVLFLD